MGASVSPRHNGSDIRQGKLKASRAIMIIMPTTLVVSPCPLPSPKTNTESKKYKQTNTKEEALDPKRKDRNRK